MVIAFTTERSRLTDWKGQGVAVKRRTFAEPIAMLPLNNL